MNYASLLVAAAALALAGWTFEHPQVGPQGPAAIPPRPRL
jgi:hypothetical protein